jgi:hypothetical protein
VARAAVVRHVDAVVQSRVEQKFAAARQKPAAVDSNLATFLHCPILLCFRVYRSNAAWHWQGSQEATARQKIPELADECAAFREAEWQRE